MYWGDYFVVGDTVKIVDREDGIHIWVVITKSKIIKGDIVFHGKMIDCDFIKVFSKNDIVDYWSDND